METEQQSRKFDIIENIKKWSLNFNLPVLTEPKFPEQDRIDLSVGLIEEELKELKDAVEQRDFKETQDALGDILWVTVRAMMEFGIDPNKTIEVIYKSNMSKLDYSITDALITRDKYSEQGIKTHFKTNSDKAYVTYRSSDDKVLKSHNFKQPIF